MCRCAHDRIRFARAGWGRLSVGLYVLFLEKWLEHFHLDQFLVMDVKQFDENPRAYMAEVFQFLDLSRSLDEAEWGRIVGPDLLHQHANEYPGQREPMLPETKTLLDDFYRPYNELLICVDRRSGGRRRRRQ